MSAIDSAIAARKDCATLHTQRNVVPGIDEVHVFTYKASAGDKCNPSERNVCTTKHHPGAQYFTTKMTHIRSRPGKLIRKVACTLDMTAMPENKMSISGLHDSITRRLGLSVTLSS